jgi:hypothetical protein
MDDAARCASMERLVEQKFALIRDRNSPILANFGRTLERILKSFKSRLETVKYVEWVGMIERIAEKFPSGEMVHIVTQKALCGLVSLFPMEREYGSVTVEALVRLFQRCDSLPLKRCVVSQLCDIWGAIGEEEWMIEACRSILSDDIGAALGHRIYGSDGKEAL